jgi:hypothetical protein
MSTKKQTWQQWARAVAIDPSSPTKLFKGVLGALTGQDARALNAIVACFELYANSDEEGQFRALSGVRALLPAMQRSTQWIARELIPYALDWDDRERLWRLVDYTPWVSDDAPFSAEKSS